MKCLVVVEPEHRTNSRREIPYLTMADTEMIHLLFQIAFCFGALLSLTSHCLGMCPVPQTANDQFPPTTRRESNTSWPVTGTVSSAGLPVPNSKIFASQYASFQTLGGRRNDIYSDATSSLTGEFEIKVRANLSLVVTAPGLAPACLETPVGSQLSVEMTRGRSVTGTINLPDGTPAVGATITPVLISRKKTARELENTSQANLQSNPSLQFQSAAFPDFGKHLATQTDQNGNFKLSLLPEHRVGLAIGMDGYVGKVVFVAAENEDADSWRPDTFVETGFVFKLSDCVTVEVKGVDDETGSPVAIKRVRVQLVTDSSYINWLFEMTPGKSKASVSLRQSDQGYALWVEPANKTHLGKRVVISNVGERGQVEKVVRFGKGVEVRGRVTSRRDNSPIMNATFAWKNLKDKKSHSEDGNFMPWHPRTNAQGRYVTRVPNVDGVLGIVGEVDGFASITSLDDIWMSHDVDAFRQFAYRLEKDGIARSTDYDFQLTPAPSFFLRVLNPNKTPSADAVVNASIIRPGKGLPIRQDYHQTTQSTDSEGRVTLPNWYTHALWIRQARLGLKRKAESTSTNPNIVFNSYSTFGYPTSVEIFSSDGVFQANVFLPLPSPTDFEDKHLSVALEEGASLVGKIVDQLGQPLANINVTATTARAYQSEGGQTWETKTRADGRFRLKNVPPAGNLQLSVDQLAFETAIGSGQIAQVKQKRAPGSTMILEPIECLDLRALLDPIAPLELNAEDATQSLELIKKFLADHLARIPDKPEKYSPVGGGSDPIPIYRSKVLSTVLQSLQQLSKKHAGSDVEFEVLKSLTEALKSENSRAPFGDGERKTRGWILTQLLKHHVNRDAVAEVIPMAIRSIAPQPNGQRIKWKEFAQATDNPLVKQAAFFEAAWGSIVETSHRFGNWASDESFQNELDAVEKMLDKAVAIETKDDKVRDKFVKRFSNLEKLYADTIKNQQSHKPTNPSQILAYRTYKDRFLKLVEVVNERIGD